MYSGTYRWLKLQSFIYLSACLLTILCIYLCVFSHICVCVCVWECVCPCAHGGQRFMFGFFLNQFHSLSLSSLRRILIISTPPPIAFTEFFFETESYWTWSSWLSCMSVHISQGSSLSPKPQMHSLDSSSVSLCVAWVGSVIGKLDISG